MSGHRTVGTGVGRGVGFFVDGYQVGTGVGRRVGTVGDAVGAGVGRRVGTVGAGVGLAVGSAHVCTRPSGEPLRCAGWQSNAPQHWPLLLHTQSSPHVQTRSPSRRRS